MKILPKKLTYKGFNLKQIIREGKLAIYEQTLESGGKMKNYEVILIESHNGYEIAGNVIPPSEVYPSSEQWGIKGFTHSTYEDAIKKFEYLKKLEKVPKTGKRGRKRKS